MKKNLLFILLALGTVSIGLTQDKMYVHTSDAGNISADATYLDHPLLNNNPNAKLIVSHCWDCSGTGIDNDKITGVYYSSPLGKWSVFNENQSAMLENRSFFVYVADDAYAFRADSGAGGSYLYLDNALLNGNPDRPTVLSNHYYISNWDNKNYGFWYDNAQSRWAIYDESLEGVPEGSSYFVATAGEDGIEGYRHVASAINNNYECTRLDHPALNANPNAKMVFTHNWEEDGDTSNIIMDNVLTAYYGDIDNAWFLCNEDYSDMPVGALFDVLIYDGNMGVNDLTQTVKTTAFPNPAIDYVNFNSKNTIHEIKLYDRSGKEVMNVKQSSENVELNISSLPAGVYIANVKTSNGVEVIKLIKK